MDVSEATLPHLNQFALFHIELNKFIKLSTSAFDYLAYNIKDPNTKIDPKVPRNPKDLKDKKELSDLIANLIKDAGQKWYPTTYTDPQKEIADLKIQLVESAIMRVFSSFEVYLDEINGTYSEYIICNNKKLPDHALLKLYTKFGWPDNKISYLIPIYNFYNVLRHCVVHQMGVANQELIDISRSEEFHKAIKKWPTVVPGGILSPPPAINNNKKLDLNPHHAIIYSDVCYRVACDINEQLVNMLGYEYIVKHVAVHQLLNTHKLKEPVCKNSYAYIRYILQNDYKIKKVDFTKIKVVLEKEGIRKSCFQKHRDLVDIRNA